MRCQAAVFGLLIIAFSPVLPAGAQTTNDAKAWADLVASQQDHARRFSAWEQNLLGLHQKLEKSPDPKDKRSAALVKNAVDTVRDVDARGHVSRLTQLFAFAKSGNLIDLKQLQEQAETCGDRLDRIRRALSEEALDRGNRIAFERHQKIVRALVIYQRKLRDTQNDASLLKAQMEVAELTGLLTEQLRAFGKGSGKLGTHLQRSDAHFQQALALQMKCVQHLVAKEPKLARDCQDGATKALERCAGEGDEILFSLKLAEHHFTMISLARRFEAARKLAEPWPEAAALISKDIARNPDMKPTRENQAECNRLMDQVRLCHLQVKRMSDIVESERTSSMLSDVLGGTDKDLREVVRRLDLADVGLETQAFARRVLKSLDAGRNFAEGANRLIAALEPGQLEKPLADDLVPLAAALDKLIAEQRLTEQRLSQRHDARLRQVVEELLNPKEKKK